MNVIGTSTLLGARLTFVGFCFTDHPVNAALNIQLCVYRFVDRAAHVLCVSEVSDPDVEAAKDGLGGEVYGSDIAPFAARLIEEGSTKALGTLLRGSFPNATFYWHSPV
jgi:hypothetical protein